MKKKFAALCTVCAMTAALTACGGGSEAPADAANAFHLGTIGPLTGENAIYGQAVANGAQLAVDEINAKGGIQFALQPEDDVADPETAVNAYHSLLDDGMQLLVGPTTTGSSLEVSSHCFTDRVFMLTPSATSPDVTAGKDNVFQVCFTDPNQGTSSAEYMAQHMPDATIGILYQNDEAYCQGVRDGFAAKAKELGLNVVYENTFTKDTATNFEVQLHGAQAADVDLLFMPIYYQHAAIILNQAKAMGYAPTFFGVDGMDGILALPNFDTSLAEGLMLLTPFSADGTDEATVNFVTTYREQFENDPNQFAADAYDAVYILKDALEAAGATPDMTSEELCELVMAQMPQLTYDGLTGQGLNWSANGEVSKSPMAMVIQNGIYVPLT